MSSEALAGKNHPRVAKRPRPRGPRGEGGVNPPAAMPPPLHQPGCRREAPPRPAPPRPERELQGCGVRGGVRTLENPKGRRHGAALGLLTRSPLPVVVVPAARPTLLTPCPPKVQAEFAGLVTHTFPPSGHSSPFELKMCSSLSAHLWGMSHRQHELRKHVSDISLLHTHPSSCIPLFGKRYLTSNELLRTETWAPSLNASILLQFSYSMCSRIL